MYLYFMLTFPSINCSIFVNYLHVMEILFNCCYLYNICTCLNLLLYLLFYMYTNVEYTMDIVVNINMLLHSHSLFLTRIHCFVVCDFECSDI